MDAHPDFGRLRAQGTQGARARTLHLAAALLMVCALAGTLQAAPHRATDGSLHSVRLDQFASSYPADTTPAGWHYFSFSPLPNPGSRSTYRFVVGNGDDQGYIHLRSSGRAGFGLASEQAFDLSKRPVLAWEWRAIEVPRGGDVRVPDRDDQAGSMCVVMNPRWLHPDAVLCYLWQDAGSRGAWGTADRDRTHRFIILRTAADPLGIWMRERRDIAADWLQAFGYEPSGKAVVAITIDSNDTDSDAEADYRNIRVETQVATALADSKSSARTTTRPNPSP